MYMCHLTMSGLVFEISLRFEEDTLRFSAQEVMIVPRVHSYVAFLRHVCTFLFVSYLSVVVDFFFNSNINMS